MGASFSRERRDEQGSVSWCRPLFLRSFSPESFTKKNKKNEDLQGINIISDEKKLIKQQIDIINDKIRGDYICSSDHQRALFHDQEALCSNGCTKSACGFTQEGDKGVNQDAFLIQENFASRSNTVLCAVFDGHGPHGHLVARRVRDILPTKLMAILEAHITTSKRGAEDGDPINAENTDSTESENDNGRKFDNIEVGTKQWRELIVQARNINMATLHSVPTVARDNDSMIDRDNICDGDGSAYISFSTWRDSILECCVLVDQNLRMHPGNIDCFCSGTTALFVLKQGEELIVGNVGDSRAVLATSSGHTPSNGNDVDPGAHMILEAVQLTVDLKPDIPKEMERIQRCKGRVFCADDEPDVPRIWMPCNDSPGLATSRTFGDFCLKDFGLISDPEITYRRLSASDQFVILATDGIWDVLSNIQAVEVVSTAPFEATAAQFLVETAIQAWSIEYPASEIDDCAAVCLFFNSNTSSQSKCLFSESNFIVAKEHEEVHNDQGEVAKDIILTRQADVQHVEDHQISSNYEPLAKDELSSTSLLQTNMMAKLACL